MHNSLTCSLFLSVAWLASEFLTHLRGGIFKSSSLDRYVCSSVSRYSLRWMCLLDSKHVLDTRGEQSGISKSWGSEAQRWNQNQIIYGFFSDWKQVGRAVALRPRSASSCFFIDGARQQEKCIFTAAGQTGCRTDWPDHVCVCVHVHACTWVALLLWRSRLICCLPWDSFQGLQEGKWVWSFPTPKVSLSICLQSPLLP